MIETEYFQMILVSIGIGSTAFIAWLFKHVWKLPPEKIFEENLQSTSKIIFYHLSLIDSYKLTIYEYLEDIKVFNMEQPFFIVSKPNFDELLRFQSLIREEAKSLPQISKLGGYITLNQYLAVLQYAASAHSFLYTINSLENAIGVNKKAFVWHRYYAAQVIRLFDKTVPKDFRDEWHIEFAKVGGIDRITKPIMEPGDMVGPEYNLHNSLLYL